MTDNEIIDLLADLLSCSDPSRQQDLLRMLTTSGANRRIAELLGERLLSHLLFPPQK